jgi:hypothetical protein
MALLPMGPPTNSNDYRTDRAGYYSHDAQETMFDEPTALAVPDAYETSYEATDEASVETAFEPVEEFADDVPELISYQSGSGHAGIDLATEPENPATEVAEETLPEAPAAIPFQETVQETPPEPVAEPTSEPASAAPTMLTANDFVALEERVLRAVALVRSERQARIAAEERVASMEAQLHSFEAQIQQIEAQSPILERLVQEVESLRIEREQVRQRVERLLGQLDALEL